MVALLCVDSGRNGRNGSDDTSSALTFASSDGILDGFLLCILHDIEILTCDR